MTEMKSRLRKPDGSFTDIVAIPTSAKTQPEKDKAVKEQFEANLKKQEPSK